MHEPLSVPVTLPLSLSIPIAACTQYWGGCEGTPDLSSILAGDAALMVIDERAITASGSLDDLVGKLHGSLSISSNMVLTKFFVHFMERRDKLENQPHGFDMRYTYTSRCGDIAILFLIRMAKLPPSGLISRTWAALTSGVGTTFQYAVVGPTDRLPDVQNAIRVALATQLKDTEDTRGGIRARFPLHRGSLHTVTATEVASARRVRAITLTWEVYTLPCSTPFTVQFQSQPGSSSLISNEVFTLQNVTPPHRDLFDVHVQHGQFLQTDPQTFEFLANAIVVVPKSAVPAGAAMQVKNSKLACEI